MQSCRRNKQAKKQPMFQFPYTVWTAALLRAAGACVLRSKRLRVRPLVCPARLNAHPVGDTRCTHGPDPILHSGIASASRSRLRCERKDPAPVQGMQQVRAPFKSRGKAFGWAYGFWRWPAWPLVGLDPYLYGLYNHNITVPFLLAHPGPCGLSRRPPGRPAGLLLQLFPQGAWRPCIAATGWSFESACFCWGSSCRLFASLWAMHGHGLRPDRAKRRGIGSHRACWPLACAVWPRFGPWSPFSWSAAWPCRLQLWALERMLRGRWYSAFALAGLSFPIHPLSAAYAGFIVGFSALVRHTRKPGLWLGGALLFLWVPHPAFTSNSPSLPRNCPCCSPTANGCASFGCTPITTSSPFPGR